MTTLEPKQAELLPISKLHPFEGHPFQVKDNEEMDHLVESIKSQGILSPLVVRPLKNGDYEVVSGHRRLHACRLAGMETVPALVYEMDRDAATIALVDSNLHREHILPSERAFAYKMKLDAMKRQGQRSDLTSAQVEQKLKGATSVEILGEQVGESRAQIQRYIRLTNLEPELLELVDQDKIALTPAVELSHLQKEEQQFLKEAMAGADCTPSLSQAVKMKKLSQAHALNPSKITEIMAEQKANQREKISFRMDEIRDYFPKGYDAAKIQSTILKLLNEYQKKRHRDLSR